LKVSSRPPPRNTKCFLPFLLPRGCPRLLRICDRLRGESLHGDLKKAFKKIIIINFISFKKKKKFVKKFQVPILENFKLNS
jgi:hypothetical protein